MPKIHRYQPVGSVLVRASTHPDPGASTPLDLTRTTPPEALAWLSAQWTRPDLREAVTMASPDLAARVHQLLDPDLDPYAEPATPKAIHRAVLATASYLLRWQRRVTPFGLFAGVTTATIGPASATVRDDHRAVARADADWLTRLVDRLEQDHDLRRTLSVVANSGGFVRDGRFIVAARPKPGQRAPGSVRETSARYTRAVQVALACAAQPVRFDQLVARIADQLQQANHRKIEALLHGLIDGHVLITNLRPPMTAVDGLAHVIKTLRGAVDADLPEVTTLAGRLGEIHAQLTRHNSVTNSRKQAELRPMIVESMACALPSNEYPLAVDVRLDAQVQIPQRVLDEAISAAGVLLRLTTQPFGSAAWLDYHIRFRTRYGPGAVVPISDLVADSGLGYPAGYLGAPRARPAWRVLTERDAYLLGLVQRANLDQADEIRLTDVDIEAMTVGDPTAVVPPPRVELGVAAHAPSTDALNGGDFELRITGAPRAHTSMAGRFANLLDGDDRERLANTYARRLSMESNDVVPVQMSFPPRRVHNENVVRVGRLLVDVVSVSEHQDGKAIGIEDLAVTCDAHQFYLVQASTGRRIVPHVPHALDVTVQTPPLARFIAEVADARSAVFGPLDLGAAARTLRYTPRIRYQRTVLVPARWLLTAADVTVPTDKTNTTVPRTGDRAGNDQDDKWDKALHTWRRRWRVPARVIACYGELRLPLDLDQPLDRAVLRNRLGRARQLEVREDGPADGHGWSGRPVELLIPMTLTTPEMRRLPVTAPPGETLRPGESSVVQVQLVGNPARFDDILTDHLPVLVDSLTDLGVWRWWVRRHRDMIRLEADQHLSVVLHLKDPTGYGAVAARLAKFAANLHAQGLPADLFFSAYHQHPGRYGQGPAMEAAERVFATDTAAAVMQLRMARETGIPTQVIAAVSMAQLAAGFAWDAVFGYQALLVCLKQHTEPTSRALTDQARDLADAAGTFRGLRMLPGGEAVAAAWRSRRDALRAYHDSLRPQRDPADVLRTLLHEHHVRAVGVDPEFERKTGHLARAAAMRCLAQARSR
ncbi:lantibiotic dehydratase [Micromonospora sp. NPDC050397]|uniref:lantibiotic dehydratase n=1 Tax=Micromonospora sp. NPDC050397 TaxID=3364279 RepID=UPI00384F1AF5